MKLGRDWECEVVVWGKLGRSFGVIMIKIHSMHKWNSQRISKRLYSLKFNISY